MKDIREILSLSEEYLAKHRIESPKVKAEWLISHSLGMKRLDLFMQHDRPLSEDELSCIRALLKRCASHEPVQYICGSTSFYGYEMQVGPGVLIPRPETEILVDLALKEVQEGQQVLDLCTGSGCIPIAMQLERNNQLEIYACDLKGEALEYAQKNITLNKAENIQLIECDLFDKIPEIKFDLITSNPPYVSRGELNEMGLDVKKHEPESALFAENDGMAIISKIAYNAKKFLKPGAKLFIEIGIHQGPRCLQLFEELEYTNVEVIKDYSQRDRILKAQMNS